MSFKGYARPLNLENESEKRSKIISAKFTRCLAKCLIARCTYETLLAACDKADRDPATMRTSVNAFIDLGADGPPPGRATLSGSASAVVDQLGQYAELGFDEFILPDWNLSPDARTDSLARIKTEVLDQLSA